MNIALKSKVTDHAWCVLDGVVSECIVVSFRLNLSKRKERVLLSEAMYRVLNLATGHISEVPGKQVWQTAAQANAWLETYMDLCSKGKKVAASLREATHTIKEEYSLHYFEFPFDPEMMGSEVEAKIVSNSAYTYDLLFRKEVFPGSWHEIKLSSFSFDDYSSVVETVEVERVLGAAICVEGEEVRVERVAIRVIDDTADTYAVFKKEGIVCEQPIHEMDVVQDGEDTIVRYLPELPEGAKRAVCYNDGQLLTVYGDGTKGYCILQDETVTMNAFD